MSLLVLDTSSDRSAVGVSTASGEERDASSDASRRHGRDLAPMIGGLLDSVGVRPIELTTIAVGLGPGSYTGLRIGLTAARTLAYAAGARLVAFDSLEGFAQNAPADARRVWVVADAQRGDVYCASFTREEAGAPLSAVAPSRIEPLPRWIEGLEAGALVLGPGLESEAIRSALPPRVVLGEPAFNRPSGLRLLALARRVAESGAEFDPRSLEPNYLRRSAAEDQWEARGGRP
jgi:tRNA threonylcarbamoyladenosine biosynthesis protein TsaB